MGTARGGGGRKNWCFIGTCSVTCRGGRKEACPQTKEARFVEEVVLIAAPASCTWRRRRKEGAAEEAEERGDGEVGLAAEEAGWNEGGFRGLQTPADDNWAQTPSFGHYC